MAKGWTRAAVMGNVSGRLTFFETDAGVPGCSFYVAVDEGDGTVWSKVNAYGAGIVGVCRAFFTKGAYVAVEGELMNRLSGATTLLEVRAKKVMFHARREEEGDHVRNE